MANDGSPSGPPAFVPVNPYALARAEAVATQIKRFYTAVSVAPDAGGFAVLLDGRPARTPKRQPLVLPREAAAALIAAEFSAQGDTIRPGDMPVLRLANSVIDGVSETGAAVRAEVLRYVSADLLLYRADTPADLVRQQAEAWDPVLEWARLTYGAGFHLAQGITHVTQPDDALAAMGAAIDALVGEGAAAPFRLGALHVLTTLTGSALLGLAVLSGELALTTAWQKAHVDEDFQIMQWGADDEAAHRRALRWADAHAAARLSEAVVEER